MNRRVLQDEAMLAPEREVMLDPGSKTARGHVLRLGLYSVGNKHRATKRKTIQQNREF